MKRKCAFPECMIVFCTMTDISLIIIMVIYHTLIID